MQPAHHCLHWGHERKRTLEVLVAANAMVKDLPRIISGKWIDLRIRVSSQRHRCRPFSEERRTLVLGGAGKLKDERFRGALE